MKISDEIIENAIKGEIYSVERLEEYAAYLAAQLKVSDSPKVIHSLLPRMRENGVKLLAAYRALTEAIHRKDTIPPAAEWLTDNFFIVEDQLREIQEDLPPAFYKELPKLSVGDLTGYPRIYAIALALIAHTDSQLEPETIRRFVQAYQKISPLTIGELWALAITLRLVLVENLRRVALRIVRDHEKRNEANKFADHLFEAVADKDKFQKMVEDIPNHIGHSVDDDCAFMAQIAKRLRDQEPELWPALEFIEKDLSKKNSTTEQVVHFSHQLQASNQVTVANVITSMRLLSSLNWREFFESVSLVDRILEKDPVYGRMDFLTRDRYRHVIEKVGKRIAASETEIAEKVVALAGEGRTSSPRDVKRSHVGYYLIGKGVTQLEKYFKYKATARIYNFITSNPNGIYFGLTLILIAAAFYKPLAYASGRGISWWSLGGIFLLFLIPCTDLAIKMANLLITNIVRPVNLPKLDLSKGIPPEGRSMVVIPCMLTGTKVIQELLQKIEIHYLGNADKELFFGLLTDFTDGPQENGPEDERRLKLAVDGISELNQKYPSANGEKFFIFHRKRRWNNSEKVWMGWERKRGKIHEFNRLLRGAADTSFSVMTAPLDLLPTIRFVITLDTDTQLPRDTAGKLIGTILHPLNQPYFNKELGRITDGYGVLQPRIGISLESSTRSFFAKIFSGYTGIDPYTTAVSEVYQDLFHEGSYTGKGLYDVDAFEASLANRIPENAILSHDLFEGLYARAALVTDIELLDDYPQTYHSFFTRLHRWTRGDWQIRSWIFPFVRDGRKQWVRNRLPLISRWKIFDNLRRSLVPPALFLVFVLAWSVLPGDPLFWAGCGAFIVFFPTLAQALVAVVAEIWRGFGNHFVHFSLRRTKIKLNLLQEFIYLIFLGHQAYVQVDAVTRVFYRKWISHSKLLEWATAAQVENQTAKGALPFWQTVWPAEFLIIAGALMMILSGHGRTAAAAVLILFWAAYPLAAQVVSRRLARKKKILDLTDQFLLRQIARRTWHYFETFVGPEDHWLPPDNHQVFPKPLTAHRTSPTNIGLYMLSLVSARDFGFVNTSKFVTLLEATVNTLQDLELYEGHYLNWYDTATLQALTPKYVSTVDSGNLAGYLLAVRQVCLQVPKSPILDLRMVEGLHDTLSIVISEVKGTKGHAQGLLGELQRFRKLIVLPSPNDFSTWSTFLKSLAKPLDDIKRAAAALSGVSLWIDLFSAQVELIQKDIALFAPWTTDQYANLTSSLAAGDAAFFEQWKELVEFLNRNISFEALGDSYGGAVQRVHEIVGEMGETREASRELTAFIADLKKAQTAALRLLSSAETCALFMDEKFKNMNFKFLLDKSRGVFSIGYSVTDGKFDKGLYDLLGSESRVASFVAIAKGDVLQEHWFRLGRQLVPTAGSRALISWTASMFEYLMPILVMRNYENTLINETVHAVVDRQISYGQEHHVPWGVSEAGYNARDLQLNYQYGPFGIPGLGLKRGLSHDLVISPYSTLLAAMVDPEAAMDNIHHLIHDHILAEFGFYESIDYTPERLPENQKFAVIKSFMAHHQGMSVVAINNVVNNNVVQDRFHSDPRVRATRLLLQERIPQGVTPTLPKAAEIETEAEHQPTRNPFIRHYTDSNHATPRVQLLSNRNYSIMISAAGGGYSKCEGLAVTRWKEDPTRDNWGSFIFIRDRSQKAVWSTTYQPFAKLPPSYKVTFGEEKVEFRRRDGDISSYTQILVAPEDNVEIRHVTLSNHSGKPRILELTSYIEPVLAPSSADLDHLTFSKLFIQTEFLSSKNALLAKRRKRSAGEKENWGLHVVVTDGEMLSETQYETDREKFIGRGRGLTNAYALNEGENLSNVTGATLDPVLALRVKVRVPANGKTQVAFTTGLTSSREQALELADRYHDIHSFERESKIAWTKSQVDMRHLNIDAETAGLYQRLAERILYSEPSLKPPAHLRAVNTNVQSSLWPSGISGDLPIVVVRISDQKDTGTIRKLLRCHEYLRLKGLVYDFVILNEHETTYFQGLQEDIQQQIRTTGSQGWSNRPGGIFILRTDLTPEKDIAHIQSVARVLLAADEPLKEQINRKAPEEKYPGPLQFVESPRNDGLPNVPSPKLDFFNGLGGFAQNGREYVIQLKAGRWTPAPWINVVGNSLGFGFQISEVGSGFTWFLNSQTNRLTPWSNDPVCDPSGEIIYLRDDETGEIWTPTPLPVRTDAPYTVKHGQGYTTFEHTSHGIQHTLTVFVPKDDSVKMSLLTLKNLTSRKRKISVTSYTEWVLGSQREKTSAHLVCEVDRESTAIFARNPHDNEFASKVAFADISTPSRTFTCSRKEFLGRNGNYAMPAALSREGLSKKSATGQDPCAVLQTSFSMAAGEQKEISILLGQCENVGAARKLTLRYRDLQAVKSALNDVVLYWKNLLGVVQVKTPEPAMDILLNNWLLYQTLSCRYWSRTAFYQSGGAYGFRDQLQDCMAFVYAAPQLAREHILRASEHQFKEGDVQHWWHPPTGRGIRTRMSDDLLWLPYVVSFYIGVTGDKDILKEITPFLEAPLLKPEEEDSYTLPAVSLETATLFTHCTRAMDRSLTLGQHELPLMGTGDWNDGMNRVGVHGKGESIWLGWFQYKVFGDFLTFCNGPEHQPLREKYEAHMKKLAGALEKDGWDGNWYKRAYFDDGTPLGSASNDECKIDSIAQTWAVISRAGDPVRAREAMENVKDLLVKKDSQLVLLFTPAFDKSALDPGYIKGYVPGVRENGGQYTHAATWVIKAFAELGEGTRALEFFKMINPVFHSLDVNRYKIEPYVIAGDVYGVDSLEGRGGWSWYTGSSSWYYRVGLESILGFCLEGKKLKMKPCIANTWKEYELTYTFGKSKYQIKVNNPKGLCRGSLIIEMDGVLLPVPEIDLEDDGKSHQVTITLQAGRFEATPPHFYSDQSKL